MSSMPSPVLAFDSLGNLRLLNAAAERAFSLKRSALGRQAPDLGLTRLLDTHDQGLCSMTDLSAGLHPTATRWSVRRSSFRLRGVPHTLFVLSDVGAALREEERSAWQRLIRVLGHEINNSLTPIKSIAGSLRTRFEHELPQPDLHRGLAVIEDRAASLNRFLQAYQRLTRLPPPQLAPVDLRSLAQRVALLEPRLEIQVAGGPGTTVLADSDQLQQLLINLTQNAADAALSDDAAAFGEPPAVEIAWTSTPTEAILSVIDNGPGIGNPANLFVPFYTTKESGTGIGLVLAQAIATAHRGTLTLTNRPNSHGCQAELRLPHE